jgi:SAM-dependent methyltransferase
MSRKYAAHSMIYTQSARYYDALNRGRGKNYAAEAARLTDIAMESKRSGGKELLDIGCGTGMHLKYLRENFDCEGLDVDRSMLDIARERNPGMTFHQADMMGFNLGKQYDVITCLFNSIGSLPNTQRLEQALQTFVRHLKPGGVVLLEPWLRPEEWRDGHVEAVYVDEPDLKVARMSVGRHDANVAVLNYHYMVASRDGIRTFTEAHRLTMFTDEEYRTAFRHAALIADYLEDGLTGRGLFIGATPQWEGVGSTGEIPTTNATFAGRDQGVSG